MTLTALQVKNAKVGRHADGKGLYLLVKPTGGKSWVLRVQFRGRRRDLGLGSPDFVSLTEARKKAAQWRGLAKRGVDPSLAVDNESALTPAEERAWDRTVRIEQKSLKRAGQSLSTSKAHISPSRELQRIGRKSTLDRNGATPSRKRMTQAERTALSDSRMYQAAAELLCERGFHKTTLKDIGERASYSRGLASARFASKEGLFASLVDNIDAKWRAQFVRDAGHQTGLAGLLAILDAVEHFMHERPLYTKALFVLWYESSSSHRGMRKKLAETHERDRNSVVAFIAEGQAEGSISTSLSAERLAVQFMSFIFGTIYQWNISPAAIDVKQTIRDYCGSLRQLIGRGA